MKILVMTLASLLIQFNFAHSAELESAKQVTLNPAMKFRAYSNLNQSPESMTAYTGGFGATSCFLTYSPSDLRIDGNLFSIVDSEPKYDGGRVDIFSPKKSIELQVSNSQVEVRQYEEPCGLPDHPETCDTNPPLVQDKTVTLDLLDASMQKYVLSCTSAYKLVRDGQAPSVDTQSIDFGKSAISFK